MRVLHGAPTAAADELEAQTVKVPETDIAVLAMQVLIPVTLVGNVGAVHDD